MFKWGGALNPSNVDCRLFWKSRVYVEYEDTGYKYIGKRITNSRKGNLYAGSCANYT